MADAQRCRAGARRRRARRACVRAVAAGALDRAVDVAATLEVRGYGAARRRGARAARGRGRATTSPSSAAALALVALTVAARLAGVARASTPYPRAARAGAAARAEAALARRARRSSRCAVRRPPGDRAMSALAPRARHLHAIRGARRAGAARRLAARSSAGEFVVLAGLLGAAASRRCCAPPAASCRTSTAATFAGRVVVGGLDTRDHGPGRARGGLPGRCSRTPRRRSCSARCAPSWPSRWRTAARAPAAVARGVEEAALALGIDAPARPPDRRALRRRAAARRARRRARRPPAARAARRADVAARPGRRRRADLAAAPAQRGVGHRGRPGRAPPRALPGARRPRDRARGRPRSPATPPPRAFLEWAADARARAADARRAAVRRAPGLRPPPAGVKEARATLRAHGLLPAPAPPPSAPRRRAAAARAARRGDAALRSRGVWHELARRPRRCCAALDLAVAPGRARRADGPQRRGQVDAAAPRSPACWSRRAGGRARPGASRCCCRTPATTCCTSASATRLAAAALERRRARARSPTATRATCRGGERQRLALAIVLDGGEPPAVVCLDEPTRGMDRAAKGDARRPPARARRGGAAVIVATHDAEFAAAVADRVVLLADGRPIADGPAAEVLAGGWYFATETARILGGARCCPSRAPSASARDMTMEVPTPMSWPLAVVRRCSRSRSPPASPGTSARTRRSQVLALVATLAALAALGRVAFAPLPNVKPTTDIVLLAGFALGGAPGLRRRRRRRAGVEPLLRPGPVDAVADGRLGAGRHHRRRARRRAAAGASAACRWPSPAALAGPAVRRDHGLLHLGDVHRRTHTLGALPGRLGDRRRAVQRRPRGGQRRLLPGLRPGARAGAAALPRALRRSAGEPGRRRRSLPSLARRSRAGAAPARRAAAAPPPSLPAARAERRRRAGRRAAASAPTGLYTRAGPRWASAASGARARAPRPRATCSAAARAAARDPATSSGRSSRSWPQRASPRRAGGVDLVRRARRAAQRRDGSCAGLVNQTRFGDPRAARRGPRRDGPGAPRRALDRAPAERRRRLQLRRPRRGRAGSTTPRGALQALVAAAGARHARAARGAASSLRRQNPDGGFPLEPGAPSNAQSTAWAVQGFVAAGRDPARVRRGGSRSPLAYLRTLIGGDGAVRYSRTSRQTPVWVTAQAPDRARAAAPFPSGDDPARRRRAARTLIG